MSIVLQAKKLISTFSWPGSCEKPHFACSFWHPHLSKRHCLWFWLWPVPFYLWAGCFIFLRSPFIFLRWLTNMCVFPISGQAPFETYLLQITTFTAPIFPASNKAWSAILSLHPWMNSMVQYWNPSLHQQKKIKQDSRLPLILTDLASKSDDEYWAQSQSRDMKWIGCPKIRASCLSSVYVSYMLSKVIRIWFLYWTDGTGSMSYLLYWWAWYCE